MTKTSGWMRWVLRIAALYNILWGLWAMLAPESVFSLFSVATPTYLEFWQAIGLSTAVLGLGQFFASRDPYKHWIVTFISLLVEIVTPFGFWLGVQRGHLPASALWMIGMNDLVWWIPFSVILWRAYEFNRTRRILASPEVQAFALRAKTQYGISLLEMSQLSPTLVVFLRHLGCTFCRETLADLRKQRAKIEADGVRVALVHMATESQAEPFLEKYGLGDLPRVSDPGQAVYRAFGLDKGSLLQLFGLKTWIRGFESAMVDGNRQGTTVGDSFQMPGVFLIFHGEVLRAYRHQSPADRPDYVSLAQSQDYPIPS
jgi:peroxiredoxin